MTQPIPIKSRMYHLDLDETILLGLSSKFAQRPFTVLQLKSLPLAHKASSPETLFIKEISVKLIYAHCCFFHIVIIKLMVLVFS